MAETLEPTEDITAEDLLRIVAEIARQKELSSEYAGNAGPATKNAVERYGLERQALTWARKLHSMEATKRQACLRNLIHYAHLLGHFAQIDAFDDLVPMLEEIAEEARGRSSERATDPVVSRMIQ